MLYLLTGRSGSGLSTAKRTFERNGFLINYPRLSNFNPDHYSPNEKHLVVIDVNTAIADHCPESDLVRYYQEFFVKIRPKFKVVFLDADEGVLFRRQQEDHLPPIYSKQFEIPWNRAFAMESKVLEPFLENAHLFFDTGQSLKTELAQAIDLFLNLELEATYQANNYRRFLTNLFHDDFWQNIGDRLSIFREIKAEPENVARVLKNFDSLIRQPLARPKVQRAIKKAKRVVITGMGSSFFAGQAVKEMLQKCYRLSLPIDCIPLSEISFGNLKEVLLIINSNSGETGEIKECFANGHFSDTVAFFGITNYADSFLARQCDEVNCLFHLDVPAETSIPATVSVVLNLLMLAGILAVMQETIEPKEAISESLLNDLKELPEAMKAILQQPMLNQIFSWAGKMNQHFQQGSGFVVGCGAITSILPEVALKGIELAKLNLSDLPHSFAHGPLNSSGLEGTIYLQDTLTDREVIFKHIEKLVSFCPVFSLGPHWDTNVPNVHTLPTPAYKPTLAIFTHLMTMQLALAIYGMIKGLSVTEICNPPMLQKVVLSSPISK